MIRFRPLQDYGIDEPTRLVVHDNRAGRYLLKKELQAGEEYGLSFADLAEHLDYKFKIQTKSGRQWIDREKYARVLPEGVSDDGIKYLFYPHKGSRKLVVVFQAINVKQRYNYMKALFGIPAHRLYIKDEYGGDATTRSSYYLGRGRSFDIAEKVQRLLTEFTRSFTIRPADCIFAGSSKGGYAALYHGYRFGAGHILPGGPQVLLGSYLNSRAEASILPPILQYLAGGLDDDSVAWANRILHDVLRAAQAPFPRTEIHVGAREPHYRDHVAPFMEWVKQAQIPNVALDLGDYDTHEELAAHYPKFLRDRVDRLLAGC
jgi:accessory secretory protein Asp2